jgi:sulfatase maturation enzyme AslB (radical SAM superfamily)
MAWYNSIANRLAILEPSEHGLLSSERFDNPSAISFAERMREAGILIPQDRNETRLLKRYAERFVRPFQFTVELSRVCNFKCTYCYQNGTHEAGKVMSGDVFEASVEYVERVLESGDVNEVELNFIGGEPMLHRTIIASFLERIQPALDRCGVACRTAIDTNGAMLPRDFLAQRENTTLSVSLTPEDDHNRNRPFLGGQDSFKTVVRNLVDNRENFGVRGNQLLVRYNLDHRNASQLASFIDYLADLTIPGVSLMVVNVENYHFNPGYRNELGEVDFGEWCGVALQRMVERNIAVRTLPYGVITCCHVFKPYSCKVFYDGRLNGCDVSDQPGEGSIFEVAGGKELRGRNSMNPMTHKMCQGDYKICNLQVFPLKPYLTAYLSARSAGRTHLFETFEDYGAKMRQNWAHLLEETPTPEESSTEPSHLLPSNPSARPFVIL